MTSVLLGHEIAHGLPVHWHGHCRTLMVPLVQQMTGPPDVWQHAPMSVSEQSGPMPQLKMLLQSNFTGQAGTWTSLKDV